MATAVIRVEIDADVLRILEKHFDAKVLRRITETFTADVISGKRIRFTNDEFVSVKGICQIRYLAFGKYYDVMYTIDRDCKRYVIIAVFPEKPSKTCLRDMKNACEGLTDNTLDYDFGGDNIFEV